MFGPHLPSFPTLPPLAAGLVVLGLAAPLRAQESPPEGPVTGEVTVEFQNDWAARADDPALEGNDAYFTVEAGLEARLAPGLSAHSLLVFEPVLDRGPGRDRFAEDHGLYVEQLFLQYEIGRFALRSGKFGQKFGIAWDAAPGIWGTDFAEDYELSEQIGVAGDITFDAGDAGKHTLTAGTFFADTTILSESAFTNRGRTRRSDGGAGNTEDFSSFSLALDGGEIPDAPGLGYHLAYLSRGAEAAGETRESGVAAAVTHTIRLGTVEFAPLVEWVRLRDRNGMPGTDVTYLTTSAAFSWEQWNLALSRTTRETQAAATPEVEDSLAQISLGYAFESGINVNVGYLYTEEDGFSTDTYGVLVDYAFRF